jgi:hypothetical protein
MVVKDKGENLSGYKVNGKDFRSLVSSGAFSFQHATFWQPAWLLFTAPPHGQPPATAG